MASFVAETQIRRYTEEVAGALRGLPEARRAELLDDLRRHLAEIAAEEPDLEAKLGNPVDYAAEFVASAGLDLEPSLRHRIGAAVERWRRHPVARRATELADELAPGWWVLRGFLFYVVFGYGTISWRALAPWVADFGTFLLYGGFAAACVVGSYRLGRANRRGRLLWARMPIDLVAVVGGIVLWVVVTDVAASGW